MANDINDVALGYGGDIFAFHRGWSRQARRNTVGKGRIDQELSWLKRCQSQITGNHNQQAVLNLPIQAVALNDDGGTHLEAAAASEGKAGNDDIPSSDHGTPPYFL
jgi:hypothetical protein